MDNYGLIGPINVSYFIYFISGFIFAPILFTAFVHFLPIVDFISRLNKRA